MKEIKAFIHKNRIAAVIEALQSADVAAGHIPGLRNINAVVVQSLLKPVDSREQRYAMDLAAPVIEEYKLELLCQDNEAARLLQVIAATARTGQAEAGWVYVIEVGHAIQIGAE